MILHRPDLFSSAAMAAAVQRPNDFAPADASGRTMDRTAVSLIGSDPPEHTRLRNIVSRGFTPRRITALEPRIREIALGLVERFAARGACDLVTDYAVPLPVMVIAELLGVDPERHADFKRGSDAMIRAAFDPLTEDEAAEVGERLREISDYLDEVTAARQRCPADDLISTLVEVETRDGALSADEVKIFVYTLLAAGNVTTTNLIGNAMLALLVHPAELERVRRDPALVPALVEEALRYDAPVQLLLRTATEDTEIAGVPIPKGALVAPLFASANRDESVFPDPDRFDVTRNPRDHLAFGHGIHFCLGAPLARLEARIAFEVLLARLVDVALDEEEVAWVQSLVMRGPKRLGLRFAATAAPADARELSVPAR
jgi:cytochrome P450